MATTGEFIDSDNGPSREALFDANKYAYDSVHPHTVTFTGTHGSRSSTLRTKKISLTMRVIGLEHLGESGHKFRVKGYATNWPRHEHLLEFRYDAKRRIARIELDPHYQELMLKEPVWGEPKRFFGGAKYWLHPAPGVRLRRSPLGNTFRSLPSSCREVILDIRTIDSKNLKPGRYSNERVIPIPRDRWKPIAVGVEAMTCEDGDSFFVRVQES